MASSPITPWQIDGETMETVTDIILLGSKITSDGDCCHEINRHLFLGRKAMTNLDSILKSRDSTLPTKVHMGKSMSSSFIKPTIISKIKHTRLCMISTPQCFQCHCCLWHNFPAFLWFSAAWHSFQASAGDPGNVTELRLTSFSFSTSYELKLM